MAEDAVPDVGRLLQQLRDPNSRFPPCPALVEDLEIFAMPRGLGIQIHGATTPIYLRARKQQVVADVVNQLNGSASLDDLLVNAGDDWPDLVRALAHLHARGLIIDGTSRPVTSADPTLRRHQLFWGRQRGLTGAQPSGATAEATVTRTAVALVGGGLVGAVVDDLLERAGFMTTVIWSDVSTDLKPPRADLAQGLSGIAEWLDKMSSAPDLLMVAIRTAPAELFSAINRWAIINKVPWLALHDDGQSTDIGPLVLPRESACHQCMQVRRRSAADFPVEDGLLDQHLSPGPTQLRGELLSAATLCAAMAVGDIERFATGLAPANTLDRVYRVNQLTGQVASHTVLRVPRCSACGPSKGPARSSAPADLQPVRVP